jgi:hypothetical protein
MRVYRNTPEADTTAELERQGYDKAPLRGILLRVTPELHAAITAAAASEHRSVQQQLTHWLTADVEAAIAAGTLRPRQKE